MRSLSASLRGVLDEGDPQDPAVARLFPRTVVGDDDADAELRRLIHDDLAGVKQAGLEALGALLDGGTTKGRELRVELDEDDALLVLGVLNDVRLAIGARVGIERLDRGDLDPQGPQAHRLAVLDHLAMWQELLLAHVDPPSVRHDPDEVEAFDGLTEQERDPDDDET